MSMRPVVSHSSAGVSTGMSISWPPIAFISSRTICSTLRWTRQPSGMNVQSPALTWRMKPPRTSSLCDAASASAGSSRSVGRNSCEARWIMRCPGRLLQRNHRSFRHGKGGRLRHPQALRAMHPLGDPLVDLEEQLVDEDVGRDLLQYAPVRVDEADVAAAGNAEVGVAALPRAVHGAAEHGDLECLRIVRETRLDLFGEPRHADVVAAARRAGDHHGAALAQPERLEDLVRGLRLLDRIGGERDPD